MRFQHIKMLGGSLYLKQCDEFMDLYCLRFVSLYLHLEDHQTITYRDSDYLQSVISRDHTRDRILSHEYEKRKS